MFESLLVVLLIEAVLLVTWCRPWWGWGLPVFLRRVTVPTAILLHFPFERLEAQLTLEKWPDLLFRRLSKRNIAFRESFGLHFGWRYPPVMRGQIVIDVQRREVRIVGRCSWTVMVVVLTSFAAVGVAPFGVVVASLLIVASYLVQRHRFLMVEAAILRLAATDSAFTPLRALTSR